MRKGTNNPQIDSGFGFSRVIRALTFKRRQKAAGRTTAQDASSEKWEQTYWGRMFIKSI
jgi:hypothetical protein